MHTVNYLQVIDCTHDAAKYNEKLQDRPSTQQEETYIGLPIHQLTKPLKMTNSTSTDVIFTDAWCHRIVAEHYGYHSIAPANRPEKKKRLQSTF